MTLLSTTEGAASLHSGPPSRPQGEKASGHAGNTGEASPKALAKPRSNPHPSTTPSQGGGGEVAPSTVENTCEGTEGSAVTEEPMKIVRATTRLAFDFYALSEAQKFVKGQKRNLSALEKEARNGLEEVAKLSTTARNVAMRANFKRDSDALDGILLENNGVFPKKSADWASKSYSYPLIRRVCPTMSSNIAACLQQDVDRKWAQVRYDVLVRQSMSAPHYRIGQPFPVPAASYRIEKVVVEGEGIAKRVEGLKNVNEHLVEGMKGPPQVYRLTFSLYSGSHEGTKRFAIPIIVRDETQAAILDRIIAEDWKRGQLTIERDRLRPSKWYARLAYTRLIPKKKEGIAAAINKGMRCFIAAFTQSGDNWIYDADDIAAYLKQIQRRRKQYQNDSKASHRWGHGRARTLRPTKHLEDKAHRWRETRCQVIARRLANWLVERNVNRVYIEDFTGIRDQTPERVPGGRWIWERIQEWPYYQLQQRLIACLEENGVTVTIIAPNLISQTCPRCGYVDPKNKDIARWRLRCGKCKLNRHLDVGAAMNVLARGEAVKDVGINDSNNLGSKDVYPRKGPRKPSPDTSK